MNQALYTCVNCQIQFQLEAEYKNHYKSEHHRYNVKRKLIGMAPLSYQDYIIQFQTEQSSKSQSQTEIFCQVCSKKFMSPQTYKQHINSQKHHLNRKNLINKAKKDKSQTSSASEFQVIEVEQPKTQCLFCFEESSEEHLKQMHSFPPFRDQCTDYAGILQYVKQIIKQGRCVYCEQQFACEESVKQHMMDVGHCRLDIEDFSQFQQFYLWKINESSEEQNQEIQEIKEDDQSEFIVLKNVTLESLEQQRQNRIKYTTSGVLINGKEVGYREYKRYYKQYLSRHIETVPRQNQKCLPFSQQWKSTLKYIRPKPEFERIGLNQNHR